MGGFAVAPTQKWWQKWQRNVQLMRGSFGKEICTTYKIHTLVLFVDFVVFFSSKKINENSWKCSGFVVFELFVLLNHVKNITDSQNVFLILQIMEWSCWKTLWKKIGRYVIFSWWPLRDLTRFLKFLLMVLTTYVHTSLLNAVPIIWKLHTYYSKMLRVSRTYRLCAE